MNKRPGRATRPFVQEPCSSSCFSWFFRRGAGLLAGTGSVAASAVASAGGVFDLAAVLVRDTCFLAFVSAGFSAAAITASAEIAAFARGVRFLDFFANSAAGSSVGFSVIVSALPASVASASDGKVGSVTASLGLPARRLDMVSGAGTTSASTAVACATGSSAGAGDNSAGAAAVGFFFLRRRRFFFASSSSAAMVSGSDSVISAATSAGSTAVAAGSSAVVSVSLFFFLRRRLRFFFVPSSVAPTASVSARTS